MRRAGGTARWREPLVTERHQIQLTTRGRRSGEPRAVTLYAFGRRREPWSWSGRPAVRARHPAWALNLRDTPAAEVQEGKQQRPVHAHEAAGPERERLWELVRRGLPAVRHYQRRTDRTLPLFVLEPASD